MKIIKLAIIMVLIITASCSSATISTNQNSKEPIISNLESTVYVDDDAEPEWYDETHVKTIQEGIIKVSESGTVYVYNGTYYENVLIGKTINLIGEDKNTTIIDGQKLDHVVNIFADFTNVSGFTIQNCSQKEYHAGVYIITANNVKVFDNIIRHNQHPEQNINHHVAAVLIVLMSSKNVITKNEIYDCEEGVLIYAERSGNIVSYNNIRDIRVWNVFLFISDKNKIIGNKIYGDGGSTCIDLYESNENIIYGNEIWEGEYYHGISLRASNKNKIYYNNITNNITNLSKTPTGIYISGRGNIVKHNNFINHKTHAYFSGNFNRWRNNYWDDWIGLKRPIFRLFPKAIKGEVVRLLRYPKRLNFDWHPAKEPFDIQKYLDKEKQLLLEI